MSVPHSTILSCSRGVLAKTDVGYCSPKQSQNSSSYAENNVKVVVYPKKEDARINAPTENGLKDDSCSFLRLQRSQSLSHEMANPYATTNDSTENSNEIKERSMAHSAAPEGIDTAKDTLTKGSESHGQSPLNQIIKNKDMLIQALVLSLDIIQNNPLIINKYVIADEHELALLIKYLTDAEEVDIIKNDHECSCSVSKKYDIINRIMIKKNGEIYNLKYSYPDVNQYLYDRKFSTKFIKPTVI